MYTESNGTIMVVDDERIIRDLCKALLEDYGYVVNTFGDAISALEDLKSGRIKYDIIVTDKTMPEMSGEHFAEKVQEIIPKTPIILITGLNDFYPEKDAEKTGIREVLKKPFNNKAFVKTIREIIDDRP